jgi:hypothetical protein
MKVLRDRLSRIIDGLIGYAGSDRPIALAPAAIDSTMF